MQYEMIAQGKNKQIFATENRDEYLTHFGDEATAFNGLKRRVIPGKGKLHNSICACLFEYLEKNGIRTHFIRVVNERDMLVRRENMLPVTVVIRNTAAGDFCNRLGIAKGTAFAHPVAEYHLKNDELGHPLINISQITALNLMKEETLLAMQQIALRINTLLTAYLKERMIELMDFRVEFGCNDAGELIVTDEITPATCRFRDIRTAQEMDMDLFRQDMGDITEAYADLARRLLEE